MVLSLLCINLNPCPSLRIKKMHTIRPYRINTLFLSDLHLGSSSCHAESINQLLCSIDCKTIYLVGDIVDFWAIKRRGVGLVESHVEVIKTLLIKARQGTKIHYVTGNHDDGLRSLLKAYPFEHGLTNINLCNQCNFISKSGKKYLVLHGDQFDNQLKWDMLSKSMVALNIALMMSYQH
ncbi:UDP-2,3-diacylglucosamine diphosphatase [Idiomarina aquatica]